jgi:hypothetical protein
MLVEGGYRIEQGARTVPGVGGGHGLCFKLEYLLAAGCVWVCDTCHLLPWLGSSQAQRGSVTLRKQLCKVTSWLARSGCSPTVCAASAGAQTRESHPTQHIVLPGPRQALLASERRTIWSHPVAALGQLREDHAGIGVRQTGGVRAAEGTSVVGISSVQVRSTHGDDRRRCSRCRLEPA